jgi:hypothetical protein
MTGAASPPSPTSREPQPLYAVIAAYDVTTIRPERDIALMFKDAAVSLSAELDSLRADHSHVRETLATSEERNVSLRRRLSTLRRIQLLVSSLSVLGAVLVGFGVNYLTSDEPAPGWTMLVLGAVMQLGALAAPLVDRED